MVDHKRTSQCTSCKRLRRHDWNTNVSKSSKIDALSSIGRYSTHSKYLFVLFFLVVSPTLTLQKRILRPYDACYDDDGNPRECRPEFDNIALNKRVRVSETCGVPVSERFCRVVHSNGRMNRVCGTCERSGPQSHPARYLTDINDTGNLTYWQSKSFRSQRGGARRRQLSLIISFGKKYELSYVSLQFYSPRPEAMIIQKSMDNGRSWVPYQYYARNCQERFNLPNRSFANRTNVQETLCLESFSSLQTGERVVFNPTSGRPTGNGIENSYILQDWVTATDIKIILARPNERSSLSSLRRSVVNGNPRPGRRRISSSSPVRVGDSGTVATGSSKPARYRKGRRGTDSSDGVARPPSTVSQHVYRPSAFYAINDVTIGGRCKCNGHASRCITKNRKLVCDCKHNTDGVNCEKCKAFHYDRPWKRATSENANECRACNCNLHAKQCRFNAELFRKSGHVSGGVCQKCRHHTTGRFCHFCKPGYYKNNKTKSIAHRKVCRPCGCHPVGAAGQICDPTTGQCPCKEGVAGKKCTRCAKGFEQTRSRLVPCYRIPRVPPARPTTECPACKKSRSIQLSVNKFCKFDFVVEMKVVEMVTDGKWYRVTMDIVRIFKRGEARLQRGLLDVRVRINACMCPRLKKNRKFLILGKYDRTSGKPKLAINRSTMSLKWRSKYKRKLVSLLRRTRVPNAC